MAALHDRSLAANNNGEYHGTEGQYPMPHNVTELARLTRQHEFYKSNTENKLLTIPISDEQTSLRILDAGCANGHWLSDLPNHLPGRNLSLHGVDIGSNLFEFAPKNVSLDLRYHNLIEPIPTSWGWDGTFDIIHQRLLVYSFKTTEWPVVLRNLFKLLKPGGYIQLVEGEWIPPPAELATRSPLLKRQAALQRAKSDKAGMDIDVGYKLVDLLEGAGYEDVQKTVWKHGFGVFAKEGWEEVSAQLMVQVYRTWDGEAMEGIEGGFQGFLDALEVEIREKGYMINFNFVVGRKPVGNEL